MGVAHQCAYGPCPVVLDADDTRKFCSIECRNRSNNLRHSLPGAVRPRRTSGREELLRLVEGFELLEALEIAIRLGYERRTRELEDVPLGAIGRMTQAAVRD
ncbi:MAG: hypothetical protein AB7P99_16475 [Vicinamibacterales bacterium]